MLPITIKRLGRVPYDAGLVLQEEARARALAGADDECLVLEHDPVVTLGKRGGLVDEAGLAALGTPVVRTDRGGFATWHGPGQLVAYPIIDTARAKVGVRRLVRALGSGWEAGQIPRPERLLAAGMADGRLALGGSPCGRIRARFR